MNFADRSVQVEGNAPSAELIEAVENIGYKAKPMNSESEQDALDEKAKADNAHYKKLMRNMVLALGVGAPLMLYGLIFDMSVTTTNQRIAWGVVGIITFVVMAETSLWCCYPEQTYRIWNSKGEIFSSSSGAIGFWMGEREKSRSCRYRWG
jgi:cation transport ATPase